METTMSMSEPKINATIVYTNGIVRNKQINSIYLATMWSGYVKVIVLINGPNKILTFVHSDGDTIEIDMSQSYAPITLIHTIARAVKDWTRDRIFLATIKALRHDSYHLALSRQLLGVAVARNSLGIVDDGDIICRILPTTDVNHLLRNIGFDDLADIHSTLLQSRQELMDRIFKVFCYGIYTITGVVVVAFLVVAFLRPFSTEFAMLLSGVLIFGLLSAGLLSLKKKT